MANILVCVTKDKKAEALIDKGKEYIFSDSDKLFIVNLTSYEAYYMNREGDKTLDSLYMKAVETTGADFKMIRSNDLMRSISQYIIEKNISTVLIEDIGEFRSLKKLKESLTEKSYENIECVFC